MSRPSVAHDFLADRDCVAQFLSFGHLMRYPELGSLLPRWERRPDPWDDPVEHLLDRADKELHSAFGEVFDEMDVERTHVVPLSGGLDSRLLVAHLIGRGVALHKIRTATYGVPGALDYEYGRLVARALGVDHVAIDARRAAPTVSDLEAAAIFRPNPGWLIGAHFNRVIRSRFGPDVVYWSGVVPGPVTDLRRVAADHSDDAATSDHSDQSDHSERRSEWSDWRESYCDHFALGPPSPLTPDGWDPRSALPASPLVTTAQADPWDQLLVDVRSRYACVPEHLDPDYDVRMPYLAEGWVGFWMSVPPELRHHQVLLRKLVERSTPPAARGIPVKGYPPRSRWQRPAVMLRRAQGRIAGRSGINYLDLSKELRDDATRFATTIKVLVKRVQEAGVAPWVDGERLWTAHRDGAEDHGLGLTHLASLGAYCAT